MFNVVKQYIYLNAIVFIFAAYVFFSAVLNALTGIDVCLPCVWNLLFDIICPGCGLTRAFISLLKLDVVSAYENSGLKSYDVIYPEKNYA